MGKLSMQRQKEIRLQVERENAPKSVDLAILAYAEEETPEATAQAALEHYGFGGLMEGRVTATVLFAVKLREPVIRFSGRAADIDALVSKYNAESPFAVNPETGVVSRPHTDSDGNAL